MINYGKIFKELVESEGYELLSEYKNSTIKVKLKCLKGHLWDVPPYSFKQGRRCPKCPTNNTKQLFIDLLNKEGYKLLSDYKNTKMEVKLQCSNGHIFQVKPSNFKRSPVCPECPTKRSIKTKEQFIELLDKEGYKLLSEYIKDKDKVLIRCNNGHEYKTTPSRFKNNSNRCSKCPTNRQIKSEKMFKNMLISDGYKLVSSYINTRTKVDLICPKGHIWKTTPHGYKKGYRCSVCARNNSYYAKEEFMKLLCEEKYKLIGEYINTSTRVTVKCPNDHEWNVIPSEFKHQYFRCPHCDGSSGQRLLQEILKGYIQNDVIYNDRKVLGGLELDIYYPELSIGIEYQGNYWHSLPEAIKRDKRKRKLCEEKGINLIEVWDNDFLKDQDSIIKDLIKNIRG